MQNFVMKQCMSLWKYSQVESISDTLEILGDLIKMFKTMKGMGNICAVEVFSRVDNFRTMVHSLRVNKMRVRTVLRQEFFQFEWLMHQMVSQER